MKNYVNKSRNFMKRCAAISASMFIVLMANASGVVLKTDIDGSGCVNYFEKAVLDSEYGKTGANLRTDFNKDSVVNVDDFLIMASEYGVCTCSLKCDIDKDGCSNYYEKSIIDSEWGKTGSKLRSDFDKNGIVNVNDFIQLMAEYGKCCPLPKIYSDINGDKVVNVNDFVILMAYYNQQGDFSKGDLDGNGMVEKCDFDILSSEFNWVVPNECKLRLHSDINSDGTVNVDDFIKLMAHYGQTGDFSKGDINGDSIVNQFDYDVMNAEYGKSCNNQKSSTTLSTLNNELSVSVFPNPSSGNLLSVKIDVAVSGSETVVLKVIDMAGRVVQSKQHTMSNGSICLLHFSPALNKGMYVVESRIGKSLTLTKVVVQ